MPGITINITIYLKDIKNKKFKKNFNLYIKTIFLETKYN